MEEIILEFVFNGQITKISCNRDEYMKNIFKRYLTRIKKDSKEVCFIYKGLKINPESKLNQINSKDDEIKILVYNNINKEIIKLSKDIICPECGDNCLITINDYKITLNNCNKRHNLTNILFEEFNNTQMINELNILCHDCKKNKLNFNQFYKCCCCNYFLCPLCKEKHAKDHLILNYDLKNYLCNTHGERYTSYCKKCNKNLCNSCKLNHDKHNPINYKEILNDKNVNSNLIELRIKIDYLKKEIKEIINKFNKIILNFEIYFNTSNNLTKNFNFNNINYQYIMNINSINNFNKTIIKDIDNIINCNQIENKLKSLDIIYDKILPNNEITLKYMVGKDENIRIFGDLFVNNNKDNYQMIINGKRYQLNSFFNIKKLKLRKDILEIKLKEIKPVTDMSYMFYKCSSF